MNNKCLEIGFKEMRSGCLNYGCILDKSSNRPAYKLLKGGKESDSGLKKKPNLLLYNLTYGLS